MPSPGIFFSAFSAFSIISGSIFLSAISKLSGSILRTAENAEKTDSTENPPQNADAQPRDLFQRAQ